MVRMNPGKLDRRIILQVRTETRDAMGSLIETWANEIALWAEIPRQQGNESEVADSDRATDTRQFRIRHRAGVASDTHRISYQSRIYDIRHIQEEGRSNCLLLTTVWNQSIT